MKDLTEIFFKLLCLKGNLCGCGVTVLNPKYPRLLSGDTITQRVQNLLKIALSLTVFKVIDISTKIQDGGQIINGFDFRQDGEWILET